MAAQSDMDFILTRLPDGVSFNANGVTTSLTDYISETLALPEVNNNKYLCLATLYTVLLDSVLFQINTPIGEHLGQYSYNLADLQTKQEAYSKLIQRYQILARVYTPRGVMSVVPRLPRLNTRNYYQWGPQ
jgi:hypothetical protein